MYIARIQDLLNFEPLAEIDLNFHSCLCIKKQGEYFYLNIKSFFNYADIEIDFILYFFTSESKNKNDNNSIKPTHDLNLKKNSLKTRDKGSSF